MALDLGLVADTADRETVEAPAQGVRDGPADRCLADARGTYEEDDGARDLALADAHGEKLDDTFLDVFEAVVVAVEDLAGVTEV